MALESEQIRFTPTAALVHEPYYRVSSAFADYKGEELGLLGHFKREGARPSYIPDPESHHTISPDYHVRSSFTKEQYEYIRVVRTHLGGIAKGAVIGARDLVVPAFSERVVGNFLNQDSDPSFVESIIQSNMDMISDFVKIYPNLTPALDAFYVIGTAGTTLMLSPTHNLLEKAILSGEKGLEIPSLKNFFSFSAPYSSGEGLNMFSEGLELESEVQCAGENIAVTLWNEIPKAAVALAQIPEVKEIYRPEVDRCAPEDIEKRIRNYVVELSQKVRQQYNSDVKNSA